MEEITLPFNDLKQNALLGHLIINQKFFKMVYKKVKPNWFLSERTSKVYKILTNYYETYGRFPSREELKSCNEIMSLDLKERNLLQAWISAAILSTQQVSIDAIKPDLTEWLHAVILMKGMREAQQFYNNKEIKQCHSKLMESVKEVANTNFNKGTEVSFLDYDVYLKEVESERKEALTTGLNILDRALLEGATEGGLQKGDTTIVMAPINAGKTTTLITMACHNIVRSKDVLFMSHEGRPSDIRLKILANMLDCTIPQILEHYRDPAKKIHLDRVTKQIHKHLKYVPYNRAGMTIEEVVPIILGTQEDWMSEHDGKGFDMLVSDYPAILTTEIAKRGNLQRRNIDQIIYNNYVQLALEHNWHSLLAIQTNREGSKVNQGGGGGGGRLLGMEDVKESWDPMAEASNVITINRNIKDEASNTIIFNIAKSRSNQKGLAIVAKSNFKHQKTHSETMGGFSYTGSTRIEADIDLLREQFLNGQVPSTLVNP